MDLGQPKMTQKIPKPKKTKQRLMQTNDTSNMVHLETMIPCFWQKIPLQNAQRAIILMRKLWLILKIHSQLVEPLMHLFDIYKTLIYLSFVSFHIIVINSYIALEMKMQSMCFGHFLYFDF